MRNNHGKSRSQTGRRQESQQVVSTYALPHMLFRLLISGSIAQCYNCHTTATSLWRKDDEGEIVCNAYVASISDFE